MSGPLPDEIRRQLSPLLAELLELSPTRLRYMLRRLGLSKVGSLVHDWRLWARADQLWEPGLEKTTFACTGRGWGKTRFGAETTHMVARLWPEICQGRMTLIGRTAADVRDVMVQGESGILNTGQPDFRPKYEPSKRLLTWPNGVTAVLRSGEEPSQIRGLNVGYAWCDEYAFWKYPQTCWDNLMFALRIGANPKVIVTSTPLPTAPVRDLYKDPTTRVITGSTLDNRANLNPDTVRDMLRRYEGTQLGEQELRGVILDGNSAALWRPEWIRRIEFYDVPELVRVVVAIDPAGGERGAQRKIVSADDKGDETGIVCAGIDNIGRVYVLGDLSGRMSSAQWAKEAVKLALRWGANTIIGESNFGGDMVQTVVQNDPRFREAGLRFEMVHALEGKAARAQPAAMLYEQGRAFHVGNPQVYTVLEHQMCNWDPRLPRNVQKSPDRMDALVHAIRGLMGERGLAARASRSGNMAATWREVMGRLRR